MAWIINTGLDEMLDDFRRLGDAAGEVQEKMIAAGVEILKEEWRKSAEGHRHKDTGAMIKSIGASGVKRDGSAVFSIVYPDGKDKTGTRNAEKAFILNYGTSKIKASHWVEEAEEAAEPLIMEAYLKIWDEHIKGE